MTESRSDYSLLTTVSIMVLAAVAIAFALQYTRPVMVPFVLAIFISYLVSPVVDFLRVRLRLPKIAAVAIALLIAAGLFTLLGLLVTTSTQNLLSTENLRLYQERIADLATRFFGVLDRRNIDLGQGQIILALNDPQFLQDLPHQSELLADLRGRADGCRVPGRRLVPAVRPSGVGADHSGAFDRRESGCRLSRGGTAVVRRAGDPFPR